MDVKDHNHSTTPLISAPQLNVRMEVNGHQYEAAVSPTARLVDILREKWGYTGTKISCEIGRCGACAVQMDNQLVHSCFVMAYQANHKSICTIEGLADEGMHVIQQAFLEEGGFQCGYCTSGMSMAVKYLLDVHPDPTTEQIKEALSGNLCRCTGYAGIIRSIKKAAALLKDSKESREPSLGIQEINSMSQEKFAKEVGWVYEHSPWIAEKAWESRPFQNLEGIIDTLSSVVSNADTSQKLSLLRAHPDLGSKLKMTDASQKEQKGAGLNQLSKDELATFQELNSQYVEKFGFPFIMAVKGQSKITILEALRNRFNHAYNQEFSTALLEVDKIARFRLEELLQV